MKLSYVLLLLTVNVAMGDSDSFCCPVKIVNGITYNLVGRDAALTSLMNCTTDCVYTTESNPGQKTCFKPGMYEAQCSAESTCKCGIEAPPSKGGKIINGQSTNTTEFPWYMALFRRVKFFHFICGATLITEMWAVTAGHCVVDGQAMMVKPQDIISVLGVNSILNNTLNPDSVQVPVAAIFTPNFFHVTEGRDIALLKFTIKVDLTRFPPACLPTPDMNGTFVGLNATAIGMGSINPNTSTLQSPYLLQEGEMTIIDNALCSNIYNLTFPGMICASSAMTNEATCNGDSGSAVMVKKGDRWLFFGVVSAGPIDYCLNAEKPSLFSSVAYWRNYIESTMSFFGGSGSRCF